MNPSRDRSFGSGSLRDAVEQPRPSDEPERSTSAARPTWTLGHWIGLLLFLVPFVTVPLVLTGVAVGSGGVLALPLIPLAMLFGVVGVVILVALSIRGSAGRRAAPGARRGMRGDHPNAPSIDFPEVRSATPPPEGPSGAERTADERPASGRPTREAVAAAAPPAELRCSHCGVVLRAEEVVCPRCGARR